MKLISSALLLLAFAASTQGAELSIYIATNDNNGVQYGCPYDPFHVVVHNNSDHSIYLWQDSNSWGYRNIGFEVKDKKGMIHSLTKKRRDWSGNVPSDDELLPNDVKVFYVTLSYETWNNLEVLDSVERENKRFDMIDLEMRAVYSNQKNESGDSGFNSGDVWCGTEKSEWKIIRIWKNKCEQSGGHNSGSSAASIVTP